MRTRGFGAGIAIGLALIAGCGGQSVEGTHAAGGAGGEGQPADGGAGGTGGEAGGGIRGTATLHPLAGGGPAPAGTTLYLHSAQAVAFQGPWAPWIAEAVVGEDGSFHLAGFDAERLAIGGLVRASGPGLRTGFQGVCLTDPPAGVPSCTDAIDGARVLVLPEPLAASIDELVAPSRAVDPVSEGWVLGSVTGPDGPLAGVTVDWNGRTGADVFYLALDRGALSLAAGGTSDLGAFVAFSRGFTRLTAFRDGDALASGPAGSIPGTVFLQQLRAGP